MTTRHLVSLVTGVLILSVLFPIGLSLWLAHRQVEKRFNEELDIFSSRVALRTERVSDQAKAALTHIASFKGGPAAAPIYSPCAACLIAFGMSRKFCILKIRFPFAPHLKKRAIFPLSLRP